MRRFDVGVIAVLLAVAAVFGTVAATRTVGLGRANSASSTATVQARTQQLDRFEASLQHALATLPPPLPAVPKTTQVSATIAPPAQQRVVYRRPPPIVIVKHTHHGDDGFERETSSGGGDD